MKRERRKPTRREWEQITSSRPVVRRMPKESGRAESPRRDREEVGK